jgi:hypothetical protein
MARISPWVLLALLIFSPARAEDGGPEYQDLWTRLRANWEQSLQRRGEVRLKTKVKGRYKVVKGGLPAVSRSFNSTTSLRVSRSAKAFDRPAYWKPEERGEAHPPLWDGYMDDFSDIGASADPIFGEEFRFLGGEAREEEGRQVVELRVGSAPDYGKRWDIRILVDPETAQPLRVRARLLEPYSSIGLKLLEYELEMTLKPQEGLWLIDELKESYRYREFPSPLKRRFEMHYRVELKSVK